jgi:hypothetical protein
VEHKHKRSGKLSSGKDARRRQSCLNAVKGLSLDRKLPSRVFQPLWGGFLFFESDRIFSADFPNVVHELMRIENSYVTSLIDLDVSGLVEFEDVSATFIDRATTGDEYCAHLRAGGPGTGWLYGMHRFACASDVGEWCVYVEKMNDIAAIGFHIKNGLEKYYSATRMLNGLSIATLIAAGSKSAFPFSALTFEWRTSLLENY